MNIDMSPDCAALPSVPVLAPAFLLTPPTNEVQRRKAAKSLRKVCKTSRQSDWCEA